MTEDEIRIRKKLKNDFEHYSPRCLLIRKKSGEIIKFNFNRTQKYLHQQLEQQKAETGKVRVITVKGRQQGISTYVQGRYYHKLTHHMGLRAFILTHEAQATNNLFEIAKYYHDNCPALLRPLADKSNAKELFFGMLNSGYKIGTAGNKVIGRSSTIQLFHGSEVAYWANAAEHAKGILQAVPNEPGTEVILESTAAGVSNYFHEQWQAAESGKSEFKAIFLPWYWQEEYRLDVPEDLKLTEEEIFLKNAYGLTDEQIFWRRHKILGFSSGGADGEKAFKQEYPCNSVEAFQFSGDDYFIASNTVMMARNCKTAVGVGPLIIGVDPARGGRDRTAIIKRRGRRAYDLQAFKNPESMEIVGRLCEIITNENPDLICIDGGYGASIYDRLVELGHKKLLMLVWFNGHSLEPKRYKNKRAEMWGKMHDWLLEQPCSIPDNDELHADLCSIKKLTRSESLLQLEKKSDVKARGIRSPDCADALALTFAAPASKLLNYDREKELQAKYLFSEFNRIERLRSEIYARN